jgi:pantothenate kinase
MDGLHLTRAQLSQMADPATAFARRGAAFTFDADGWLGLVQRLRAPVVDASDVLAPSFDHAVKDPVADDIRVGPEKRIVVLEGNYVLLQDGRWKEAAALLDERWFVSVDEDVAGRRLVARHVAAGIVSSEEEGWERVRGNDLLNGREIVRLKGVVDEEVVSREDARWG